MKQDKLIGKIIERLENCREVYMQAEAAIDAKAVTRQEFTLLLSGISACRKMPGVYGHMGFEKLYHCESESDIAKAREHMKDLFGVTDKESLIAACNGVFHSSDEYEQFMTFWVGAPLFDINELNKNGRKSFDSCIALAEKFKPLVGLNGFYAWDINERIGMCRKAVACGIITDEEFWEITDQWVRLAQVFYHSYGEYAYSCLCGSIYDMYKYNPDVEQFLEINCRVLDNLLEDGGAWQCNKWYEPKEREWAVLLSTDSGCLITRAALDSENIGYMHREKPLPDVPDSGWRFFVGNESPEYLDVVENSTVCTLNTICNIAPDIMPYLHAEVGRRFGWQENGWAEE